MNPKIDNARSQGKKKRDKAISEKLVAEATEESRERGRDGWRSTASIFKMRFFPGSIYPPTLNNPTNKP